MSDTNGEAIQSQDILGELTNLLLDIGDLNSQDARLDENDDLDCCLVGGGGDNQNFNDYCT